VSPRSLPVIPPLQICPLRVRDHLRGVATKLVLLLLLLGRPPADTQPAVRCCRGGAKFRDSRLSYSYVRRGNSPARYNPYPALPVLRRSSTDRSGAHWFFRTSSIRLCWEPIFRSMFSKLIFEELIFMKVRNIFSDFCVNKFFESNILSEIIWSCEICYSSQNIYRSPLLILRFDILC
jgi:hypothetical protein